MLNMIQRALLRDALNMKSEVLQRQLSAARARRNDLIEAETQRDIEALDQLAGMLLNGASPPAQIEHVAEKVEARIVPNWKTPPGRIHDVPEE